MKKTLFVLLMVVAVALIAAAPAATSLARLTIINRLSDSEPNGGVVQLQLTWTHDSDPTKDLHFYFQVQPGDTNTYTVPRHDDYTFKVWACGNTAGGDLDVLTNLTLNFPDCVNAPNAGEPSMEKVVIKRSPALRAHSTWYNLDQWRLQWSGYLNGPTVCVDPFGNFAEDFIYTDEATGDTFFYTCTKGWDSERPNRPVKRLVEWTIVAP